jgi:hypothetical protein
LLIAETVYGSLAVLKVLIGCHALNNQALGGSDLTLLAV